MSSIDPSVNVETPAGILSRIPAFFRKRAFWVLLDQGVVSAGNFLTAAAVLRGLSETDIGVFAILLVTMQYVNSLQAALVNYPLSVFGAREGSAAVPALATASVWFTAALLIVLGAAMFGASILLHSWMIAPAAVMAMALWQIQETLRRAMMADLRFADAIWGDAVSYLGQTAVIVVLYLTHHLSLNGVLLAMAFTSAAAICVQAMQIGLTRVSAETLKKLAVDFWKLGWWTMLANASTLITSLGYWWTLKWAISVEADAVFNAIVLFFKLANPIMVSITSLIVPAVARMSAEEGSHAATRMATRYTAAGAGLLAPYFLILVLFATPLLRIVYGPHSAYLNQGPLLRLFVANYTITYLIMAGSAWLSGLGHSRWNFYGQLANLVGTVFIGLPLTAKWGVQGIVVGGMCAAGMHLLTCIYYLRRALVTAPVNDLTK